ncbi:PAS domain-containing protein, partial [Candidatus Saccharibacteria bacterium]|nr:PAS domain-containing protein [Calditrichia bacterium]NIV99399.1 PAS domain-containing protein [Candidatus Saccharibacteria bacterium]
MDILAVLDTQSNKVLHISDQVQNMLGHRAENLIGKPFPILFPEEEERTRQERLQEFRNFDT